MKRKFGYVSVLALSLAASSALAQTSSDDAAAVRRGADAEAAGEVGLEEVIVTARRVEENLQEVPISTTVFSAEKLAVSDTRNFYDLAKSIPGLGVFGNRATSTTGPMLSNVIWLRGVPGVIPYFDQVPGAPPGYGAFFDLANAQVLKGPQGTLFGQSTNGGAILYEPRRPSEDFEGYVQGIVGNYDRQTFEGAVNIPMIEEKLFLRAGFSRGVRRGYVKDLTTGQDTYDENYTAARVQAVFRPTESIENRLLFNYAKSDTNGAPLLVLAVNPNGTALRLFGPALTQAVADQVARGQRVIRTDLPGGGRVFYEDLRFINTFEWNVTDALMLRNISSYGENRRLVVGDTDGTPLPLQGALRQTPMEPFQPTWSSETQVLGKLFDGLLDYQAGFFHRGTLRPEANGTFARVINYGLTLGTATAQVPKTTIFTYAVYAEGTVDLAALLQGLKATAGFRRTWDIRTQHNYVLNPTTLAVLRENHAKGHFSADTYRLGLTYQVTPDAMVYFTNSKGYSSGGFNLTAPPQAQRFEPESLTSHEAGLKSEWDFGGVQARVNLAAYYGKYDNIQVPQIAIFPVVGQVQLVQNAAKGTIQGLEGEITLIPTRNLQLAANFAYAKGRYDRYTVLNVSTLGLTDLSDSPFVFLPKFKYNLTATYHLPIDPSLGDLSVTADWTHTSEVVTASALGATPPARGYETALPRGNLDLSVNWRDLMGREGLEGSVFVTNAVKNDKTGEGVGGTYKANGLYLTGAPLPRMFGLRLKYSFD